MALHIEFLLVLLIFPIYFCVKQSFRAPLLLIASLSFYFVCEPRFFVCLVAIIALSFIFGKLLDKSRNRFRTLIFYLGLISLIYFPFKYFTIFNFLLDDSFKFYLPIGLSFYTFQALSYIFDIFYKKRKSEPSIINFSLYISFFPQLICGPIERSTDFIKELEKEYIYSNTEFIRSLITIFVGGFKKIVLANTLVSFLVIYKTPNAVSGLEWILFAIVTRYFIYLDFSGYTDIARGFAGLFGIKIMNNFNLPFRSQTIDEFWRRWHISLSTWIRDYVFYPLVSQSRSRIGIYVSLVGSFVFLGLWHGASSSFFIYGLFNGVAIAVTIYLRKKITIEMNVFLRSIQWLFTFVFLICLPSVALYVGSMSDLKLIIMKVLTVWEWNLEMSEKLSLLISDNFDLFWLILFYEVLSFCNTKFKIRENFFKYHYLFRLTVYLTISTFIIATCSELESLPFIYEGF